MLISKYIYFSRETYSFVGFVCISHLRVFLGKHRMEKGAVYFRFYWQLRQGLLFMNHALQKAELVMFCIFLVFSVTLDLFELLVG